MRRIKWFYSKIRILFPESWKGHLTLLLYRLKIKPTINRKVDTPFKKGVVTFSADFEMAWAFRYAKTKSKEAEKIGLIERENIPVFLKLFEDNSIPITWATVGHLFLYKCDDEDGMAHHKMLRPDYFENKNWKFSQGDWYDHDPSSDYKKSPAWYAPDLIEMIRKSYIKHEIGCHTFSHIDCSDINCSKELMESELDACINIAKKQNLKLKSFVFPGGTFGNYSTVKQFGFTSYRKPMKYDIDIPQKDIVGLTIIPSSYGLDKPPYSWTEEDCLFIAKSYIDSCIKYNLVVHFWFHPSMDSWYLEKVFPRILKYVKEKKVEGKLDVYTMAELINVFECQSNK